jgi:hypothetical protein
MRQTMGDPALDIMTEMIELPDEAGGEEAATVTIHPRAHRDQSLRILEAILFASPQPLAAADFAKHLPEGADVAALMADLQANSSFGGSMWSRRS